jgi:hypothetical protein
MSDRSWSWSNLPVQPAWQMLAPWLGVLLHALALLLYLDWSEVLTNAPVADTDFATHWIETWSVSHFLPRGRLWGYDPSFMAGYPSGALYDLDNKVIEVASVGLSRTGLSLAHSYNLVLAGLVVGAPLAVYPAARWLERCRFDAALAQVAALGLWYADPVLIWSWQGGTFAFLAAVFVALLVYAAGVRVTADELPRSPWPWLVWFMGGPLIFWLHAFAFALLLAPLTVLALARWRKIAPRRRLTLALWPPLVVLTCLPWLWPALRFFDTRTRSDHFLQGGLGALAADLLSIGRVDGASHAELLGLRWLVLLIGGIGLWRLARRQPAQWGLAAGIASGLLLAYGADYLPGGGDLQPYRYIQQAAVWSTVGLGAGARRLRAGWRGWTGQNRGIGHYLPVAVMLSVALLWAGYGGWTARPPALGGPAYHRWRGPSDEQLALCRELRALPDGAGRVLTDDWVSGALLPWCAGVEVIGGPFLWFTMDYGYANATPWDYLGTSYRDFDGASWRAALAVYDVRWLVVSERWRVPGWYPLAAWLDDHPGLVEPVATVGAFRVYHVLGTQPPAAGIRVLAAPDVLVVDGLPPGRRVVLPYHWVDGLRAADGVATIEPERLDPDPVPFIAITSETPSIRLCLPGAC